MRRSGIDVIGDVPWGTHFCQFYRTGHDLVDVLVPYFREGLDAGEFCMWVTADPLRRENARTALKKAVPDLDRRIARGQMEILDYSEWYLLDGRFDADAVLRGWIRKLDAAHAAGYSGLRLTGNTFWLERSQWKRFTEYEEMIDRSIGAHRMIALCTYSLEKCGAEEILDVVSNHRFALIKRGGRWQIIESSEHRRMEQALRDSEASLRELNEALERRVAERTAESEQKAEELRTLTVQLEQAAERERRRLAHVLHDDLQQLLVATKMKLDMLSARASEGKTSEEIRRCIDLVSQSIGVSRSLTAELNPPALYDRDFGAALRWIGQHMHERHGLEVHVQEPTRFVPLKDEVRVFLFHAVRELLFNVVKHAETRTARVKTSVDAEGGFVLAVEDEGAGFTPAGGGFGGERTGGFGLFAISERVQMFGGRMQLVSAPGRGTRVKITFPEESVRAAS